MTEEEVSKELQKMNQKLYLQKLKKDLDQNYEILKIVLENVISVYSKEMEIRAYEILVNNDNSLSRDEINIKINNFFNMMNDFLSKTLESNQNVLNDVIDSNDQIKYLNQLESLSNELIISFGNLYQKNAVNLINDLSIGISDYSLERLEKVIKEILYNYLIIKVKSSISNTNLLLINNYNANNEHLDNMNKKTVK